MSGFLHDLHFGLRQLVKRPGFAAAAIITLALGIGANTAVFSFLSGYLLKPLPYPHAHQLVRVNVMLRKQAQPLSLVSLPISRVIKKQTDAFESTAFYTNSSFDWKSGGRTSQVLGMYSSASLFHVLNVKPLLGRTFTQGNMYKGRDHVAVISYAMWQDNFGGNSDVIGTTVKINGDMWRIIGVMPQGFAFPKRRVAMWAPYELTRQELSPDYALNLHLRLIGRLKHGVSQDVATAQVQHAVTTWLYAEAPIDQRKAARSYGFAMGIQPWRKALLGDRSATLLLLQGAVLLILLITCVNVANLLLSRILGRNHEMAMRSALGATRAMLARQLLGEALCLTVPGGLAGVALAWLALHFLTGWLSLGSGESIFNIALDWRVGLFALGAVLVTAALVSVLPIRHLAKMDLQTVLQEGGRTSSGGRHTKRTRNALAIAELTLATGLLAMSGLVLHSFMNIEAVDTGFRKDHVLIASLLVPQNDHSGKKALNSFYTDLTRRVREMPGVQQAGIGELTPFNPNDNNMQFDIPGRAPPTSGQPPSARINDVSQGYFKALGIPILRGREFGPRDTGRQMAIIDAGVAKKYFRDANPLGRQIKFDDKKYTIVGVAPSIKYHQLSESLRVPTIYLNQSEASRDTYLVIHTALPPSELIHPLKNLIAGMDSNVAVFNVSPIQAKLADSLSDKQTTMTLLLAFGGIALALAIVGVYAVMSYAVGQRRAECGIRLALGAQPGDLLWLILKDGLKLLAIGLVLGLGLAVVCGYLLSSQLFGVAPFDPLTLIGSAVVLCVITLAACYLPARRAAKIDPAIAIMEQ
jgi:predicted permease